MSSSNSFKTYARAPRIQYSEESFKSGMNFSTAPLQEGYSAELLNFDLVDNGESLAPRNGLRASAIALNPIVHAGPVPKEFDEHLFLVDGKLCVEQDAQNYKQILLGEVGTDLVAGTNLYTGTLYAGTCYPDGKHYEDEVIPLPQLSEEITSQELHIEAVSATDKALFKLPNGTEIHKVPVTNSNAVARAVGTFAFGNGYYFYTLNAEGKTQLNCTKLSEKNGDATKFAYRQSTVTPKAITAKEAVMWGYNMLQDNPYYFNNSEAAGTLQLLGILPYTETNQLLLSPQINQPVKLVAFYAIPLNKKYTFAWEWKEVGASAWTLISSEDRTITAVTEELSTKFSFPAAQVMLRLTATAWTDGVKDTVIETNMVVGFNCDKAAYGTTANVLPKTYALGKCSGMTYWKNRLVCWGASEDPTVLFLSDVNDPSYFPYPNNADIFEEPIVYAMPFLENLIVFTSTKVYLISLAADGLTWYKTCVYNNLDIKEWDIHLIKVVKNMVFFKSGNYYYLIVPKASATASGGLTVAPISKQIESYFDNFEKNVTDTIYRIYNYRETLSLVHYYNFLDFEDIYNVYVFETEKGVYVNYCLLYNTTSRAWRGHVYESQALIVPYKQDITRKGTLMSVFPLNERIEYNTATFKAVSGLSLPAIQFLDFDKIEISDFYIPNNHLVWPAIPDMNVEEFPSDLDAMFTQIHFFKNYQYLDTGYREHFTNLKKRYREIQFKIHNTSGERLRFYTEYLVDGELRRSMYKYKILQNTDPEDDDYKVITVERELIDPAIFPGNTTLGEDTDDINCWQLDDSMFPEAVFWKVRIPVSGKGYAPRIRFISYNEEPYEILNISWVFRTLYAR